MTQEDKDIIRDCVEFKLKFNQEMAERCKGKSKLLLKASYEEEVERLTNLLSTL